MRNSPVPEQEPPFLWERQDLIAFVGFFVLTLFLPVLLLIMFRLIQPGVNVEGLTAVQQVFLEALLKILHVGFILYLVAVVHGKPILRTLRLAPKENLSASRWILAGILLAVAALFVSSLFPEPSDSPVRKLLATPQSVALYVLLGSALAPLLEEIIFRGFIFTALADLYGWKPAVVITTVLFAGLHGGQLRGNWPAVAVILLVSYVLTIVRHRTNSLIPSVILHTAYNTTVLLVAGLSTIFALGQR
jgi:membrane protease YdiL (CAAX protease family)